MKIRRAVGEEIKDYDGLYPLYGFIQVPLNPRSSASHVYKDLTVPVEYLGDRWAKGNPQWEALAPEGFHFDEGLHAILGFTQADLLDRIKYLVPCSNDCDCRD